MTGEANLGPEGLPTCGTLVSRKLRSLGLLRPKTPRKILGVLAFETPHGTHVGAAVAQAL